MGGLDLPVAAAVAREDEEMGGPDLPPHNAVASEEMGAQDLPPDNTGIEDVRDSGGMENEADKEMVDEEHAGISGKEPGCDDPTSTLDTEQGRLQRRKEKQTEHSGAAGNASEHRLNLPPPAPKPPHTLLPRPRKPQPTRKPTIIMSSSGESERESDSSELSDPPSPVPKAKARPSAKSSTPSSSSEGTQPKHQETVHVAPALERTPGPNFGSKSSLLGHLRNHVPGSQNMVTKPAPPVCPDNCSLPHYPLILPRWSRKVSRLRTSAWTLHRRSKNTIS